MNAGGKADVSNGGKQTVVINKIPRFGWIIASGCESIAADSAKAA